jgi:hypothetical protein
MENPPDQSSRAGKTSKYFKYAIGEIVLVVIGILIALQINNWNEQNVIHKTQEKHLRAIKNEMTNNLKSLQLEQERLVAIVENNRKIITLIDSEVEREQIPQEELSQIIFNSTGNANFQVPLENGALVELINSGGLKDIENDSIRNILASWEGKLTLLRKQEEDIVKIVDGLTELYVKNSNIRAWLDDVNYSKDILKIPNSGKPYNVNKLFTSIEFENQLIIYMAFSTRLSITIYPNFEKNLKHIIKLIDSELKND